MKQEKEATIFTVLAALALIISVLSCMCSYVYVVQQEKLDVSEISDAITSNSIDIVNLQVSINNVKNDISALSYELNSAANVDLEDLEDDIDSVQDDINDVEDSIEDCADESATGVELISCLKNI